MKTILHEGKQYVIRFDRGEEVVSTLKEFCRQEGIGAGFFQGIGACSSLKLAFYDLKDKRYLEKDFNQDLEICNVTGNVSLFEGDLVIHMHGSFSDENMNAIGGHVMSMQVGGACEIMLTKSDKTMSRKLDPETGLKLLEGL